MSPGEKYQFITDAKAIATRVRDSDESKYPEVQAALKRLDAAIAKHGAVAGTRRERLDASRVLC